MKIGEFANLCGVPKDTVRYYVNIGLLIPKMRGSQMDFSEREKQDLSYIQKLKEMRFNIKEIKAFLHLSRMSNLIEPVTIDEHLDLLSSKRKGLQEEKQLIENSIDLIDEEIKNFEKRRNVKGTGTGGVPLSAVPLLYCPHCKKQLNIENADIRYKFIYSGTLSCGCGYRAGIEDGIVKTGNLYQGGYDQPDLTRSVYHEVGDEMNVGIQKCIDYIVDEMNQRDWSGKVILEANINGVFLTYHILNQMPKNCIYIIVDKYEEVLAMYKHLIEILNPDLDILYIADASGCYPLRDGSVDLHLSFFGENNYSFYHRKMQVEDISSLMGEDSLVLGAFQSFDLKAQSIRNLSERYPEGDPRLCSIMPLREGCRKCGFQISEAQIGVVTKTKKHHMFACHVDGEPLIIYVFKAVRKK